MLFSFFGGVGGVDYPHFRFNFNFKKKIRRERGNFFGTDRQTETDYPFLSGCYLESCKGFRLFLKESKTPSFPPSIDR